MNRAFSLACCLTLACGPATPAGGDGPEPEPSSSSESPSTSPTTTAPSASSTSGAGGMGGTTGAVQPGSSSAGSSDDGFIAEPPDMGHAEPCDPYQQDCPRGEKCTWYADDGGTAWNNTKCVQVTGDQQADEPCLATGGGVSGLDDCAVGLMCWEVDADNHGTCVALCTGSPEAGVCEQPGKICIAGRTLALCLDDCDPIAQTCDPGDVCIGNPSGEGFLCVLDASGEEGQLHDPCDFSNTCDPGLLCNDPSAAVECDPQAEGCCEPFCDLTDPNCPGMGQVCHPWYEEGTAPPNHIDVGYCAVPM